MPPIDVDRGLRKDSRGNMLWDTEDVLIETSHGPFMERRLVGQPDAGAIHRNGPGGMTIYMYNDDPGVFYNERGVRVPEALAEAAGFDLTSLGRARRRKEAMLKAAAGVEAEFAGQPNANVVFEHGEYRMVEIAPNLFQIQFVEPTGATPLTNVPLSLEAASKIWDSLVGDVAERLGIAADDTAKAKKPSA